MSQQFGIQISDNSEYTINEFVRDQNNKIAILYEWQNRAIDYFLRHRKAIYQVATGSGKTRFAIELIKRLLKTEPELKVLVVVPKNVILETGWYRELYNNGIPLQKIGVYYGGTKEPNQFTLTNMQNLAKVPDIKQYDMIILDEVHNYCTSRLFPYVQLPFKYKLALSATIERIDNAHKKLIEIFNHNVFMYTAQEALNDGILNPFRFVDIGVEMDSPTFFQYNDLTEQINLIMTQGGGFSKIMKSENALKFKMLGLMTERKQLVNNYERKFDVVKKICLKHKDDKILVFSQFNEQTNKFYWALLDLGLNPKVMHSNISKEKRDQTLTDYKLNKFNILLASKVLDEGFNLPSIDVGIITAGDSTEKQTIQRMGRILRKKDKLSSLYQIYCIDTIEQQYAEERGKLFKELASDYKELYYRLNQELSEI